MTELERAQRNKRMYYVLAQKRLRHLIFLYAASLGAAIIFLITRLT